MPDRQSGAPQIQHTMSSIGMMSGAYFVGRNELLKWVNEVLQLEYTKIEQVFTGAAYCQLLDMCYPGKINLSRVNFGATLEHEIAANLKLFQEGLNKVNCTRLIDVNKLAKCKYLDSLELCQWVRAFIGDKAIHILSGNDPNVPSYDPVERRERAIKKRNERLGVPGNDLKSVIRRETRGPSVQREAVPKKTPSSRDSSLELSGEKQKPPAPRKPVRKQESARLQEVIAMCSALQKERDFYFNKLRRIEIYTQEVEAEVEGQEPLDKADETPGGSKSFTNVHDARMDVIQRIQNIMYEEYQDDEGDAE